MSNHRVRTWDHRGSKPLGPKLLPLDHHLDSCILFNLYLRLSDLTCFWFLWLLASVFYNWFYFFNNKRSTKTNSLLQVMLKTNLPFIIYLKIFNKFFLVLEGSIPSNHPPRYLIKHVPFVCLVGGCYQILLHQFSLLPTLIDRPFGGSYGIDIFGSHHLISWISCIWRVTFAWKAWK